jgi:serine/threonine protein kinase
MIDFSCPHCQKKLKVNDELAGKRIRCPQCRSVQEAPLPCPSERDEATLAAPPLPVSGCSTISTAPDHQSGGANGEVVKGNFAYEVEEEIARGGMGAILRGVDQGIRREVAIKFLLNHADERDRARFLSEAKITGQLEHPNIVPIHQLGVHEDGRCFFSMKMIKGRSLADILKEQAQKGDRSEYSLVRLLNIFSSICNALGYAHSRGIIHRDLKPANIMVGEYGEVYVMDWGLAKPLGTESGVRSQESGSQPGKVVTSRGVDANLTQTGAVLGTPAYMPPEQAMGEAVDQRSDIYSLGAILYEILTLSPPVGRGGDQLAILMRVAEGAIKPPDVQAPERARQGWIPPELSAVAMKALAKNPAQRYQRVEDLQKDIQLYLEGRSVSAKRDTAWELFRKLVKRNKGVSIATAAALVVLAVVASVFLKINYDARVAAEVARVRAEENYDAYLKEQEQRKKQGRDSIPSLLTAARLLIDKRAFDAARAQVRVALDFDPEHTETRYLKGQLALVAEDFGQAQQELGPYARQHPNDLLARDLLEFLPRARANDDTTRVVLAEICTRHHAYALADGALVAVDKNAPAARQKLLAQYKQRLEHHWPGKCNLLRPNPGTGTFHFGTLTPFKGLKDLEPLRGIPLSSVEIYACEQLLDLGPLEGMPLTKLGLRACKGFTSLKPLRGMRLTWLHMGELSQVKTLEPLRGMPLEYLDISGCNSLPDLKPLRGMPLTELYCGHYATMKLNDLEPLTGMKLKKLELGQSLLIKDLRPLSNMPLEWLAMRDVDVDDFDPLRKMPLTYLQLMGTRIRDLEVLKRKPLKVLNLTGCRNVTDLKPLTDLPLTELTLAGVRVRDLTPLAKMKLTRLGLQYCTHIENFDVLKGMPLTDLNLEGCQQLQSLELVRGMKLEHLNFCKCHQIDDLAPLAGMQLRWVVLTPRHIKKGWEILKGMNLQTVSIDVDRGHRHFSAVEFWKSYDKGEFK